MYLLTSKQRLAEILRVIHKNNTRSTANAIQSLKSVAKNHHMVSGILVPLYNIFDL